MVVLIVLIGYVITTITAPTHSSPAVVKTESWVKKNPKYQVCFLGDT